MTSTTAPRSDNLKSLSAYRSALREYLESDTALDEWRGRHYPTVPAELEHHAQLMQLLHAGGWNRYGWPESADGLGGDERHRAVLYDELSAHGLPVPGQHLVMETLGPPTVRFAPEIARTLFPGFLGGTEWWGQGFSEPEAGSDLASLRCRATREGDTFVVNGQKLWTSYGATARRLVCLVRTGTPESRHRGLSMLLIDVDTPGVQARPIALASGREELAEVFFDSVRVPADRLIGDQDQGWAVAMYLLQFERGMYAWLTSTVLLQRLQTLRDQLRERGIHRDGASVRLGNVYLDIVALRARSARTVQRLAAGETIGPEASTDKILLATAEQSLYDAARDLLGPLIDVGTGPELDTWRDEWWYSRAATILGGSAEVQRGIIADRVLKLP
jgi:alkylation response protein AidB-like acyl-CoA dehydrogenase